MKTIFAIALVAAAVAGCETNENPSEAVPADNTKVNERDRDMKTLTPIDQGNSDLDLAITQDIRRAVVKDEGLSLNAKNVKIITNGTVVTLRGPVESEEERAQVGALAQLVAGVSRVNNQLEIAPH